MDKDLNKIDTRLNQLVAELSNIHPDLLASLHYIFKQEGKRIRPLLTLTTSKLFAGVGENIDCLPTAVGIELLHSYSLIHDDLPSMDDAQFRRSLECLHIKFSESIAILVGDGLAALAFQSVACQNMKNTNELKDLIIEFSKTAGFLGIIDGQAKDLDQNSKYNQNEINKLKTAKLFSFATESVAIIHGLDKQNKNRKLLKNIGQSYGLAYQLCDDLDDQIEDRRDLDFEKIKLEIIALIDQTIEDITSLEFKTSKEKLLSYPLNLAKKIGYQLTKHAN